MAHKLKEQTDYYKEKTEARQSICYIIINKNESKIKNISQVSWLEGFEKDF